MKIVQPPYKIGLYTMMSHKHDNVKAKNRLKLLNQTPQVWRKDGLNSCSYKALSVQRLHLYVNVTVDVGKPSISRDIKLGAPR
ncbi:hypothetical protein LDENG_00202860 [Lucifuga dentata]|nr:hypothetical protein LDENG_00202860 [Lucifuga dentata]